MTAELSEKILDLQIKITEDNAKVASLGFLLQLAEPSMNGEALENDEAMQRLFYDVGAILRDYTERISNTLSDLEFITR